MRTKGSRAGHRTLLAAALVVGLATPGAVAGAASSSCEVTSDSLGDEQIAPSYDGELPVHDPSADIVGVSAAVIQGSLRWVVQLADLDADSATWEHTYEVYFNAVGGRWRTEAFFSPVSRRFNLYRIPQESVSLPGAEPPRPVAGAVSLTRNTVTVDVPLKELTTRKLRPGTLISGIWAASTRTVGAPGTPTAGYSTDVTEGEAEYRLQTCHTQEHIK